MPKTASGIVMRNPTSNVNKKLNSVLRSKKGAKNGQMGKQ